MTKDKFVKKVNAKKRVDGKPETTSEMIDLIFDTLKEVIKDEDSVSIINFGTFSSKFREERVYKVPQTDRTVTKAATTVPKFKYSKNF
ncbi:MAG TPA: HU family DNA-binding protein [Bacteroidia bacterium]|nr:HU family DNA-binding protein [Bacteroidia bacterium]